MDKSKTDRSTVAGDPQTGGVTSKDEAINTPHDVFATSGSEPVRDREVDKSKGTPVTRYFTKDGTPVEPSNLPGPTPSNLAGPDPDKIPDDIITAVEYMDEGGSVVTHDSLKGRKDADSRKA